MVRLKAAGNRPENPHDRDFNSNMVRLKEGIPLRDLLINAFQFQHGAIKSILSL